MAVIGVLNFVRLTKSPLCCQSGVFACSVTLTSGLALQKSLHPSQHSSGQQDQILPNSSIQLLCSACTLSNTHSTLLQMAQQHTTPERSLAAAADHEQRARAGSESRLRKDSCYELYEASLKCEAMSIPNHNQHASANLTEQLQTMGAHQPGTCRQYAALLPFQSLCCHQALCGFVCKICVLVSATGCWLCLFRSRSERLPAEHV